MPHFLRWIFRLVRTPRPASHGARVAGLLLGLVLYASTGLYLAERGVNQNIHGPGDAAWWAIVTMTTVGYGDLFPVTWQGRWLVSFPTMVLGIGLLGYAIGLLTTAVIERHSQERKGMLPYSGRDHVIICHCPSEEHLLDVVEEIRADASWRGVDVVVVTDALDELPEAFRGAGIHFLRGNPSREAVLEAAGVRRARSAMVLAQDPMKPASDNQSLGVLVTIRALNPGLFVVVECNAKENVKLFQNGGASEVVGMSGLSAELMVQGLQDPGVTGVLSELLSNRAGHQLYIVPVERFRGSYGALLEQLGGGARYAALGLVCGAERRFLPDPATPVEPGMKLMLVGASRPAAP